MNARPAENLDMASVVGHFINGADVADNTRTQPITNPATGEITKQVAMASRETVEDAITAAAAAFPAWRNTRPAKRAKVMFRFKQLLEERADDIVAIGRHFVSFCLHRNGQGCDEQCYQQPKNHTPSSSFSITSISDSASASQS